MANRIQIKRGLKANLPVLNVGEPAFTNDTKEFFIGDGLSNIEFAKQSNLEITNTHLKDLTNNKANKTDLEKLQNTVNNIDLSATKVNLNPISGLNSKNVQAGMQELFTFASNGKSAIAGKVGNVTGNNTHAEIANRIQVDKNTMANNLSTKGVGASGNEALASLASKIGSIQLGKKYITGTIKCNATERVEFPDRYLCFPVRITGLDFTPSLVVLNTHSYVFTIVVPNINTCFVITGNSMKMIPIGSPITISKGNILLPVDYGNKDEAYTYWIYE